MFYLFFLLLIISVTCSFYYHLFVFYPYLFKYKFTSVSLLSFTYSSATYHHATKIFYRYNSNKTIKLCWFLNRIIYTSFHLFILNSLSLFQSLVAIFTIWLIPSLKPSIPQYVNKVPRRRPASLPVTSHSEPHQLSIPRSQSTPTLVPPPVDTRRTPEQHPRHVKHTTFLNKLTHSEGRPKLIRKSSVIFTNPWSTSRGGTRASETSPDSTTPKPPRRPLLRRLSTCSPLMSPASYFSRRPSENPSVDATYAAYLKGLPRFNCEIKPRAAKVPESPSDKPLPGSMKRPFLRRRDATDGFTWRRINFHHHH